MLELRDLARRFGDVVALDGISFTVTAGQMSGFVGPNGAGKTTAMRIVLGVLADYAAGGVPVVFSSHQLELVERLCEAVAIIKDGRLVASGRVEELRDRGAGGRRVRVEVQADGDEWLPAGAEVVDHGPRGVLVALDGLPPDAVLDAARRAGTVSYFALERPTLTDLFREAVAA